ncbi:MAG: tetratricopeptide repeat protein [Spirochaetes bacterium]|nr:tetratricopeptide repeat protein [Spirochaetota bacterium]
MNNNMDFPKLNKMLIDAIEKSLEQKYEEGEAILLKALEDFPKNYLPYYNLGVLYVESDQPNKAIPILLKAETLKPNDCDTYIEIAFAYNQCGEKEKAREYYDKALCCASSGYSKAIIYNNIGSLFFAENDFFKAKEYFKKALFEEPENMLAGENLVLVNTYIDIIN